MKKNYVQKFLMITSLYFVSFNSMAQKYQSLDSLKVSKVKNFLSEVYLNCPIYVDSVNVTRGVEFLDRVVFHKVPLNQYPECLLLSSVRLKNKCNPNLTNDLNFTEETFNPFKYLFSFYSDNTAFFRVDGKDIIIEIKPQKK